MAVRFTIRFTFPPGHEDDPIYWVHLSRNWGEELLEPIVIQKRGVLSDIDRMSDLLEVTVLRHREVTAVRQFIGKSLRKHNLFEYATVTEERLPPT